MFKIGDFSKLAQVSVKTLRYYDRLNLLKPAWIDRFTGYRYYTPEQLPRLNRILALKDLGFTLEQIGQVLRDDLSAAELRGMMRMKQSELERQLREEQARLGRVEARLRQIEREGALPTYEVVLKSIPSQRVAGIRDRVPGVGHIASLFDELQAYLKRQDVTLEPASPSLAVYYDAEYRERGLDVEVAVPLTRALHLMARVQVHELDGVERMACAVHHGPYERLGEAYQALLRWVESNGYRASRPNRDVYLYPPQQDRSPADYVTEVQIPVQKKTLPLFLRTFFVSSQNQESNKMEPKIVEKLAFTVVGMPYYGKNENGEIKDLWVEFNPRIPEIKDIVDGAFGMCAQPDESGAFKYLAGMGVSSAEDVPEGMQVWEVPAQKYAVFPCTLSTIGEAYKYAFETWLPQSEYEFADSYDFEYYDESFDDEDIENATLYIYIPIK
jgi:predicted transcriptional regulator YdeE